jgi:protein-disulfide isomerase/uncharacterized membrane protein YphA (DoxX/SURF4 family)
MDRERFSGWMPWVSLVVRLALAGVWFYAVAYKLADPQSFIRAIRAYRLVPESFVVPIGYGVPVFEVVVGTLFLVGLGIRAAAVISLIRLVVFTAAIASAWARGLQIECGCFGGGGFATSGTHYLQDIIRNTLLMGMTALLVWRPRSPFSLDNLLREWHERQPKLHQHAIEWGGTVALIAVLTVVGLVIQLQRYGTVDPNASEPLGTVDKYDVPWGDATAPVEVKIVEDYQCPNCRLLQQVLGSTITKDVDQGKVLVEYVIVTFLDGESTTQYSSRAANAAACVEDLDGTDDYVRMHDALMAHQPAEGTAGLSDDDLINLAVTSGANRAAVTSCINEDRFGGWVAAATDQASKDGYVVTPVVVVNGVTVDLSEDAVGAFDAQVNEAQGGS